MKKSNKLLLLFILFAFASFGSAHLALYWKYKQGNTHDLNTNPRIVEHLAQPAYLTIKGCMNVTITPSDSFFIEFDNPSLDPYVGIRTQENISMSAQQPIKKGIAHYQIGDTLLLSGFDTLQPAKAGDNPIITQTPTLRVNCRNVRLIRQEGGTFFLDGDSSAAHAAPVQIALNDVQFTLGIGAEYPNHHYDRLSIEAIHSNLNLYDKLHVRQLQLQLDSSSSVEIHSDIDQLSIRYDPKTRLNLDGATLKKITPIPEKHQ